jgi:hypothetical protein
VDHVGVAPRALRIEPDSLDWVADPFRGRRTPNLGRTQGEGGGDTFEQVGSVVRGSRCRERERSRQDRRKCRELLHTARRRL